MDFAVEITRLKSCRDFLKDINPTLVLICVPHWRRVGAVLSVYAPFLPATLLTAERM